MSFPEIIAAFPEYGTMALCFWIISEVRTIKPRISDLEQRIKHFEELHHGSQAQEVQETNASA